MKYLLSLMMPVLFAEALNMPHLSQHLHSNTFFMAFSGAPKTLDPAKSYSADSNLFIAQIVEPPLAYSYLTRPYALEPLAAKKMPVVTLFDKSGHKLPINADSKSIATAQYDIEIRADLKYAPHPAFVKPMPRVLPVAKLAEYPHKAARFATAADFVYAIKRLASPRVHSPIYSIMAAHIKGFSDYNKQLQQHYNLQQSEIAGVKVLDDTHFRIITNGYYRPLIYWLAMPFFAPMPHEVDEFYAQDNLPPSIGHDWAPVGTGPYMMSDNDPNSRMVLTKNPNFHAEYFPEGDELAGTKLPMVDRFVFSLEKESISSWNKFLQGYYDVAGVSSDNFDQVVAIRQSGEVGLSQEMVDKGIRLTMDTQPSLFYFGFNMLDPVVGGFSESARLLRHAISIAINQEEFLSIFLNGRGVAAHGPIPDGIWGSDASAFNKYVYDDKRHRKSIVYAKQLLKKAGYPNGINPKTGKNLVLTLDTVSSAGADDKSKFNWYREQFAQLGIKLDIEATQYNRFQDKMRKGQAQIFNWGWIADYPDPENFLFLLYGPNAKVKHKGENAANYDNPKFNKCFEQMRDMPSNVLRKQVIDRCIAILQYDAPWVWGFSPKSFNLSHAWQNLRQPNAMVNNSFKYIKLDYKQRLKQQQLWNVPNNKIFLVIALIILFILVAMICCYQRQQKNKPVKRA